MQYHCMLGGSLALILFTSFMTLNIFKKEFVDEKSYNIGLF